ncbi:MAG: BON domain-containing protein, partial [Blastocatellia bacterium]
MFYRKERTWVEKTKIFDRKTRRSLKKELRNRLVINLLLGNLGRIGSRLFGRKRSGAGIKRATAAGVALGAGAGLMYLFDPDRGARRRARLRDMATHTINKTGSAAGAASRDLTNRARGFAAQASSILRSENTDDDTLVARVRSKMGRAVSHPGAIEVSALDGLVKFSGDILAQEVDTLLSCARSAPGVRGLDNQLRIHSKPGDMPNLQGGRARRGARFELMQRNWSPTARLLTTLTGCALMGLC